MIRAVATFVCLVSLLLLGLGCGGGSEAIRRGVGAECGAGLECTEDGQLCLTEFKGGYCGVAACLHDVDCPAGSACVTEDNGANYCFLICADKTDCNPHRTLDNESGCVSSLTFVDGTDGRKVCRPPMSGTAAAS
jgi:hypothetical protein